MIALLQNKVKSMRWIFKFGKNLFCLAKFACAVFGVTMLPRMAHVPRVDTTILVRIIFHMLSLTNSTLLNDGLIL
jgi:hypothetical protein